MKKIFLTTALISMTLMVLLFTAGAIAQTSDTTSKTAVTKSCCKSKVSNTCDKTKSACCPGSAKSDKPKCCKSKCCSNKGKCSHVNANTSCCKMSTASASTTMKRKSCCEAMKNKCCKMQDGEKE